MRFVHITDPHLTSLADARLGGLRGKRRLGYLSWQRRRRHLHRPEVLEELQGAVARVAPDLVLVTGDLTQLGRAAEIEQARQWLRRWAPVPVLLVPGNHDLYQRDSCADVFEQWCEVMPGKPNGPAAFPYVWSGEGLQVIGLCSACPMPFWSAQGALGGAQLARLETVLSRDSTDIRCVLLHHPPLPGSCQRRKALRDDRALSALLERYQPEIVLHGHLHRNRDRTEAGGMRIFATASASNADARAPASFRVFELLGNTDTREIRMALHERQGGGGFSVIDEQVWAAPLQKTSDGQRADREKRQ